MFNPYVILGIAVAWLGTVVGSCLWYGDVRETAVRAQVTAQKNAELVAANAALAAIEARNRHQEAEHAEQVAAIGAAHEQDIEAYRALRDRDVAAARAGAIRLRDPGARPQACGEPASAPSPDAPQRDDPAPTQLSDEAAGFLLAFADDADATVLQLTAAQSVIRSLEDFCTPKGTP